MIELTVERFLPVVIGLVLVIPVGVILFFWIRRRRSGEKSPAVETKSQDSPLETVSPVMVADRAPPQQEQDFGLRLVLDNDEVFYLELPTSIGRSEDNNILIDDDSVSNHHARIFYDQRLDAVCIEDLDSVNGIFIDGRPTRKNVLDDGARLTFGSFSLTFRDTGYLPPSNASGEIANG